MLLCATAESVMRLERTELQREAKTIQEIYLRHQYHETLLQYLENEFALCGNQSLFIQVKVDVFYGHLRIHSGTIDNNVLFRSVFIRM